MYLTKSAVKNINFSPQLFEQGNLKTWDDLKLKYNLTNEIHFKWLKLKHTIPDKWKTIMKQNKPSSNGYYFENIFLNTKFDQRKIYILPRAPTTNTYFRSFQ